MYGSKQSLAPLVCDLMNLQADDFPDKFMGFFFTQHDLYMSAMISVCVKKVNKTGNKLGWAHFITDDLLLHEDVVSVYIFMLDLTHFHDLWFQKS